MSRNDIRLLDKELALDFGDLIPQLHGQETAETCVRQIWRVAPVSVEFVQFFFSLDDLVLLTDEAHVPGQVRREEERVLDVTLLFRQAFDAHFAGVNLSLDLLDVVQDELALFFGQG